jgi:glutamate-1-semialdehyde 2,1-aminomutase
VPPANLTSDFVVLGKGLGTGVSFGLYGMSDEVAKVFTKFSDVDIGPRGIATGGTTYATSVAIAAARAALCEVLTPGAYERIDMLGKRLADGLGRVFAKLRLPWTALHLAPRSGYCLKSRPPRTGLEALESIDTDFIDTRRLYLANRGI